ncbi:hypothetical protein Ndes2526B_g02777 [Nannochloris sp. 'desiccata']
MNPLLGKTATGSSSSSITVAIVESLVGMVLVAFIFWHAVHYFQDHIQNNPSLMMLYPFVGVASIVAELPFLMYISLSSEFGPLHPLLRPSDYIFLLKKLASAAQRNNMKVSSKEL